MGADGDSRRWLEWSRVCSWLTTAIQLFLAVAAVVFGLHLQWGKMALMVLAVVLTAIPHQLMGLLGCPVPAQISVSVAVFVLMAMFFGTTLRFYDRFWWWDWCLHAASGFLLGLLGLIVLFLLDRSPTWPRRWPPAAVAAFALTFATTLGVGWEVFEYASDTLFPRSNMQVRQSGVNDTMVDLVMNLVGATAVGILVYVRGRQRPWGFPLNAVQKLVDIDWGRRRVPPNRDEPS